MLLLLPHRRRGSQDVAILALHVFLSHFDRLHTRKRLFCCRQCAVRTRPKRRSHPWVEAGPTISQTGQQRPSWSILSLGLVYNPGCNVAQPELFEEYLVGAYSAFVFWFEPLLASSTPSSSYQWDYRAPRQEMFLIDYVQVRCKSQFGFLQCSKRYLSTLLFLLLFGTIWEFWATSAHVGGYWED